MRIEFTFSVMRRLMDLKVLDAEASVLAVCAGSSERELFERLGLKRCVITSLDPTVENAEAMAPFVGRRADVRKLPFADGEFDFVFVSDGLHHCDGPHGALLEMYRVARRGVVVFESRDNWLVRASVALGISDRYELRAVRANGGTCAGVNYTCIPNFVYRWTEREFEKTIACADPTGRPRFYFFHGANIPRRKYGGAKGVLFATAACLARLFFAVFRKQRNSFCMVGLKPTKLFPWLERDAGGVIRFKG
jgi:SAM-dependent methyltransferase